MYKDQYKYRNTVPKEASKQNYKDVCGCASSSHPRRDAGRQSIIYPMNQYFTKAGHSLSGRCRSMVEVGKSKKASVPLPLPCASMACAGIETRKCKIPSFLPS